MLTSCCAGLALTENQLEAAASFLYISHMDEIWCLFCAAWRRGKVVVLDAVLGCDGVSVAAAIRSMMHKLCGLVVLIMTMTTDKLCFV